MSNEKYNKYAIEITLIEDGSTTHLGEFKISKRMADHFQYLDYKKPRLLKKVFTSYLALCNSKWFGVK